VNNTRGYVFWAKVTAVGSVSLVAATFLIALLWQYWELQKFVSQEPIGRLVNVGEHELHINCTGEGPATVVLEAGGGMWSLDWLPVQEKISRFAKVCSYDRAGFGWSDFGPEPRTINRLASELRTLLSNAEVPPPYIMVGASFGGSIVQVFEQDYPELVSALVLVDGRPPNFFKNYEEIAPNTVSQLFSEASLINTLFGYKVLAMAIHLNGFNLSAPELISEPFQRYYLDHGLQLKNVVAGAKEALADAESDQRLQKIESMGDKPLTVISHGNPTMFSNLSVDQANALESLWTNLQLELVEFSDSGKHILAQKSGHLIQFDQPELVSEEVSQLAAGN